MNTALILGGAKCVYEDADAAKELFDPDIVIAVKDIGIVWPDVDHWVTYHPERIPNELRERRSLGYDDPKAIWTYERSFIPYKITVPIKKLDIRGGSSGFLAIKVGRELGCVRMVLAGVPLDPDQRHFHDKKFGRPWVDGANYHRLWKEHEHEIKPYVKSMSGWTKGLLGAPCAEWFQ